MLPGSTVPEQGVHKNEDQYGAKAATAPFVGSGTGKKPAE